MLAGILIIVNLFLISFLLSTTEKNSVQAKDKDSSALALNVSDNPNVIAGSIAEAVYKLGGTMNSAEYAISSGMHAAASVVAQSGRSIARSTQAGVITVVRTAGKGIVSVGHAIGGGITFILGIPGDILTSASNTSVVRAVIRPSDHEEIPIIDPDSPALHAALTALPPAKETQQATPQGSSGPAWPMHGEITTHFGVAHWPFQHTHTGIDISDGQPSGVTPIKPFRPGRVVDTIYSNRGLGNHIIVDHGNGVTSVYAHLASISVQVEQEVTIDTTLGFEGSTGASTGTHLHFEIRVDGQAADPRQFIGGQP